MPTELNISGYKYQFSVSKVFGLADAVQLSVSSHLL